MSDDPQHRQYRVRATMPDGTVEVLYASTTSPADALTLAMATWHGDGVWSERIAVFTGHDRKTPGRSWSGRDIRAEIAFPAGRVETAGMRFSLRTLVIALALGPPVLAGAWTFPALAVLVALVLAYGLFLLAFWRVYLA